MKIKLFAKKERGELVTETENYLHFKFTGKILKISDDVEFFFSNENTIHFRSASSHNLITDFGLNLRRLKRIEEIL